MASFLARNLGAVSLRQGARLATQQQRRTMSGDAMHAHHVEVTERWRKISIMLVPFVSLLLVVNGVVHFSHEHHEFDADAPQHSYMGFRKKAFPWEESSESIYLFIQ